MSVLAAPAWDGRASTVLAMLRLVGRVLGTEVQDAAVSPGEGSPETTAGARGRGFSGGDRAAVRDTLWLGPAVDPDVPLPWPDIALVLPTSGSTGSPKLVALSGAALTAGAEATAHALGGHGRWLVCLPPVHIASLAMLVRSQVAHTVPTVMEMTDSFTADGFLHAHEELLAAAARTPPDCPLYVSVVPTQLQRLLDSSAARRALTRYRAVLVGGAATAPAMLAEARACGIRATTTYGSSETAGGCVYNGRPLPGTRVGLDPAGRVLLSTPSLMTGYLTIAADGAVIPASEQPFTTTPDGTRALATSDLGRIDAGVLSVLGRADDVIISGGEKIAPERVERAIVAVGVAREALVVGVPDPHWGSRAVALVVLESPAQPDRPVGTEDRDRPDRPDNRVLPRPDPGLRSRVADAVRPVLRSYEIPREAIAVSALPRLGIGKVDRPEGARMAAAALARA